MSWYGNLEEVGSRGRDAKRPGSLAGLAEARRIHQGQFFTPTAVATLMWSLSERLLSEQQRSDAYYLSVLDTSMGSGRLLQFASPDRHTLYGVDVDDELIAPVGARAKEAGFRYEFLKCGMQDISARGFDVGLINPPFSLHIDSPFLEPFPCTTYGRFGPHSAAMSHAYAVAQALQACRTLVALLPAGFAEEIYSAPAAHVSPDDERRLVGLIELPEGVFKEEKTAVRVSLLLFGELNQKQRFRHRMASLGEAIPAFGLNLPTGKSYRHVERLRQHSIDEDKPRITLPVTGNNRVRLSHDGRRIRLKFACGLTEAKVMNAVLREKVMTARKADGGYHRYPKEIGFVGQGLLDIEVHLMQPDRLEGLRRLERVIRRAGGAPDVDPGLRKHIQRASRSFARAAEPFRHTIWVPGGQASLDQGQIEARAKKTMVANPQSWGSPVIEAGQVVTFTQAADGYAFEIAGRSFSITAESLAERFKVTTGAREVGWTVAHEGLRAQSPEMAQAMLARARKLGIDKWLTWEFQLDDAVEIMLKPKGAIAAWMMGLGKARLGLMLILLSGCNRGLMTVEAGLIEELRGELKTLGLDPSIWKFIESAEDLAELRQVNIISYERLRMPVAGLGKNLANDDEEETPSESGKRRMHLSYAGQLRRRVGIVVSDEGDLLSNPESLQSKALWQISAKKRIVLSGTPIANNPKDILPILAYTVGDGTAAQPWGWFRAKLETRFIESTSMAQRGIEAFREHFVVTTWTTREYEDTLIKGAKREIPRIAKLNLYREIIAPHIKRRVHQEPDVAKVVTIPVPEKRVIELNWDDDHLAHYLTVAEDFAAWYMEMRKRSGLSGGNLIATLARIQAVCFASDFPQHEIRGFGSYSPLTSKQRWALKRIKTLTEQGHKTIVYAENPGHLNLLHRHLADMGISSLLYHGQISLQKRGKQIYEEFRTGPVPNLLAGLEVTQKGLNLPEADRVLMLSRSWSATSENQAIARPCRPQQKRTVHVEYAHLRGGIDLYKSQMVLFKADSANAGLDWAEPETDNLEFLHLDTVLNRFIEGLAQLRGVKRHEFRASLSRETA